MAPYPNTRRMKYRGKKRSVKYLRKRVQPKYSVMSSRIGGTQIHKHKRSTVTQSIVINCLGSYDGTLNQVMYNKGISFALDDLPNISEFITLYDSYKLYGVKIKFFPLFNTTDDQNIGTGARLGPPILYTYIDKDDNQTPFPEDFLQFSSTKYRPFTRMITQYVRPRINREIFRNGITSGYEVSQTPAKIDMSYTNVAHFGLKFAIVIPTNIAPVDGQEFKFNMISTYYFLCYTPR